MKERPILFSGEMMKAVLAGRKTQTRRVIKPQPPPETVAYSWLISTDKKRDGRFMPLAADDWADGDDLPECGPLVRCPYGSPGDQLWCRETWAAHRCYDAIAPREIPLTHTHAWMNVGEEPVWWRADGQACDTLGRGRWRPSIHMPRWASRATLEVTEVRTERLQDITAEDIIAEGFGRTDPRTSDVTLRSRFAAAWEAIHGLGSWDRNDWLWVVSFEVVSQPAKP